MTRGPIGIWYRDFVPTESEITVVVFTFRQQITLALGETFVTALFHATNDLPPKTQLSNQPQVQLWKLEK
jgi:hypothetical protein